MSEVVQLSPLLHRLQNYGRSGLNTSIRGSDVAKLIAGSYGGLIDLLPNTKTAAIAEPLAVERHPLTHEKLKHFVSSEFDLSPFGISPRSRVSLLLPNGPELAVAVVCLMSKYCAAPINPTNTWQEIKSELQSTQAEAILILAGASANEAVIQAATEVGVKVLVLIPAGSHTGLFRVTAWNEEAGIASPHLSRSPGSGGSLKKSPSVSLPSHNKLYPAIADTVPGFESFDHPHTVLLLHTSGTSGNKKLVPYSLDMIVIGVGCIVSSWALTPADVCLNMMPLFHIGGIMRNILSPLLSGGTVITCSGFDPLLFWDILYGGQRVTWYYAAPTMHHALLQEAAGRPQPLPVTNIRFIANAAGGLLPVLAESLRNTFQATILTSYGMTECMPISSPPQNYQLDPTGTSGIPVGPEVIIVDDSMVTVVPPGCKGNILIRGPPCFGGYENNGSANSESFFTVNGQAGYFNTGDMGSMDEKGYLFISGRSKEIINRGGETISPFEIEEAVQQHPFIRETMAFAAAHKEYQETVGIVIVPVKGKPRVDLLTLYKFLDDKLHRSKWPQVLIYMDALPKNAAGKILRIRFGERTSLGELDDEMTPLSRLYEADCPPLGSPLTLAIPIRPVIASTEIIEQFAMTLPSVVSAAAVRVDLPFLPDSFVLFVCSSGRDTDTPALTASVTEACSSRLHFYLNPQFVALLPQQKGAVDVAHLSSLAVRMYAEKNTVGPRNAIEAQLETIWKAQLGSGSPVSVTASFFDIGGDSLKAGQLVAAMRKKMRIQLSVSDLFASPTIELLAQKILSLKTVGSPAFSQSNRINSRATPGKDIGGSVRMNGYQNVPSESSYANAESVSPFSNTSLGCLLVQALPLTVLFPLRRLVVWFVLAGVWVNLMKRGMGRFDALVCAMLGMRVVLAVLAPLAGIAIKWILIGRYKPGRYPLWGSMYLRWWLVEQSINILGKGIFRNDLPIVGPHLVRLYWELMGARIGSNVKIHKDAKLGQADLLTIGDDVYIDNATVRPFCVDEGHFFLLPITIGSRCSVGVKTVVVPGADMPAGTCLGPLSSTYEMEDSESHYRNYCRTAFVAPPAWLIIFIGIPILIVTAAAARLPWFFGLKLMVSRAKAVGWYHDDVHSVFQAFLWWITPQRLIFYFLLRMIRCLVVPFIQLGLAILIKWTLIGKFEPMNAEEKAKPWNRFRYWLMSRLLPGGSLGGVSKLVGTHYEVISIIYRLLGAKVGRHVYWPGSGLEIVEYDLLEVGDDVVFGSRTVILTSSAVRSAKVTFEDGCMIADRCVILPGANVKRGAVLGSGSLAAEDFTAPQGSVWVGSSHGCAVNAAPADSTYASKETITPFGRAFYLNQASYTVIPLWGIVMYNMAWHAFCTCFRNCGTPLALIICQYFMEFSTNQYPPLELFKYCLLCYIPLNLGLTAFAMTIDIGSKWLVMGRRLAGAYPWDESDYCQRWQLYLTLQEIRRADRRQSGILDMIRGSQYLVWYFNVLGSSVGRNVCLYPNGGDPMMTEPDLVTIGDGASVDDASLIAHINTRGIFRLNPLYVGNGCVLRGMTRLLSGASMEEHSVMLEHTLVLAGDAVDTGKVWQGWPSTSQVTLETYRKQTRKILDFNARRWFQQSTPGSSVPSTTTAVVLSSKQRAISSTTEVEIQPLLGSKAKGYGAADDNDDEIRSSSTGSARKAAKTMEMI